MKTLSFFWVLALVLCLVTVMPGTGYAQTKIAVIDVARLLNEAKAGQSLQGKLQKQRDSFVSELAGKEKILREDEQKLMAAREDLTPEEFVKRKKAFEEKLLQTRNEAQKKKRDLEKSYSKAMDVLQGELLKAVRIAAKNGGYDMVLSSQGVVVVEKEADISEAALQELNKAISDVPLDMPKK